MTTETTPTLSALRPEYLKAKVAIESARKALKAAEARPEIMTSRNRQHATEVTEIRRTSSGRLITNQQAHSRGGAYGASVVYRTRCRADGHDCRHDPTEQPFADDEIEEAEKQITTAQRALTKATKALDAADPTLDVVAAAQQAGARFVWWPASRFLDPRKFRYRGLPITADELAEVGPIELQRLITAGEIVDVQL